MEAAIARVGSKQTRPGQVLDDVRQGHQRAVSKAAAPAVAAAAVGYRVYKLHKYLTSSLTLEDNKKMIKDTMSEKERTMKEADKADNRD